MKIALLTENSQKKKNHYIYQTLNKVAQKYHHEVFNYGVFEEKDMDMEYVETGLLASILLTSGAVDFVIMGCASGQGVMMTSNAMPNVLCGLIEDVIDAKLFLKVNGGNAVSIPFGKNFGVGYEFFLESIFETLFETEKLSGYPKERQEIQLKQYERMQNLKKVSHQDLISILEKVDKKRLYNMLKNDYFAENFFMHSKNDELSRYLKNFIDSMEE